MKPGVVRRSPIRVCFRVYRYCPLLGYLGFSFRSRFFPGKTVLFFPQRPGPLTVEFKLCKLLGYSTTGDPNRRFDVAFKRKAATFFDPAILRKLPVERERVINADSLDIGKEAVARAFGATFGYELAVDPSRYSGAMVEKSNMNCTHDGRVIAGPMKPRDIQPGKVYQKAIIPQSQNGCLIDYRVPIHGEQIPLVYVQHVPVKQRFSRRIYAQVDVAAPETVFSANELASMIRLARNLGIDYCEFDVLRDRADELIYVVDANNTPTGPPWELPRSQQRLALERLARSFERLLRSREL